MEHRWFISVRSSGGIRYNTQAWQCLRIFRKKNGLTLLALCYGIVRRKNEPANIFIRLDDTLLNHIERKSSQ